MSLLISERKTVCGGVLSGGWEEEYEDPGNGDSNTLGGESKVTIAM